MKPRETPSRRVFHQASLPSKSDLDQFPDETVGLTASLSINHDTYTRQEFIDAITRVRAVKQLSFQSTKDIQFWDAPDNSGAGCVAQYARFTDTYKETGIKVVSTTLLVADVRVVNGQRVLYELTEVLKVLS